jgi:mannose-1-phosphate guanylyltransferase / mannose-6-phosphate isomerase
MALYPVIMCGGAGTRLWPASRPSRPKPFLKLTGDRSLFQETVLRVAPLAEGGRLIVVGGQGHARWITDQLAEIGVEAQILLEPQARDSGPAMAAAAAWTQRIDPQGVNAFVASDHHIPDASAFRAAVTEAAAEAERGRIVTLGVAPTSPASAYGYIKPAGRGLSRVEAFVEKPDASTAGGYIMSGYLWNSGNFIVRAGVLMDELRRHAPGMAEAALAALPEASEDALLGPAFAEAPKLSIDYAVMEKTELASVLEVHFQWSDLGAWDALAAVEGGGGGKRVLEDAEGCVIRAAEGMVVAAVGVRNLAIIAERDAVLVCDLDRAQNLKGVIEALKADAPGHLDFNN